MGNEKSPLNKLFDKLKTQKLIFGEKSLLIIGSVVFVILAASIYYFYLVMRESSPPEEPLAITLQEGQEKTISIPLAAGGLGLFGMLIKDGKIFLAPEAGVLANMGEKGFISKFWDVIASKGGAPFRAELEAQGIPLKNLSDMSKVEVQVVDKLPESTTPSILEPGKSASPYKYVGTYDSETNELIKPFNYNKYQGYYDSDNNVFVINPINDAKDPAGLNLESMRKLFSEESVKNGLPPIPGDAIITIGPRQNISYGLEPLNTAQTSELMPFGMQANEVKYKITKTSDNEITLFPLEPIKTAPGSLLTGTTREDFITAYNKGASQRGLSPLPEDAKVTIGERVVVGSDGKIEPYESHRVTIEGASGLEPLNLGGQEQTSKIPAIVAGTAVGGTSAIIAGDTDASPTISITETLPSPNQSFQTYTQGGNIFTFDPNSGRVNQTDNSGQVKEIYSGWGKTGSDYTPEAARSFSDAQYLANDQPRPPEYYLSPTEAKIDSYLGQFTKSLSDQTDAVALSAPLAGLFGSAAAITTLEATAPLINPLIAATLLPPALWETYKAVKRDMNDPVMIKRAEEMAKIPELTPEQQLGVPTDKETQQSTQNNFEDYRSTWEKIAPSWLGGKTLEEKYAEVTAQNYEAERQALEDAKATQTGQFSGLNSLLQKEKDTASPPDTQPIPETDRGADAQVATDGQRKVNPGVSMLPDYWGDMGPAVDDRRLPFQATSPEAATATPNNNPLVPSPTQGVQPVAGAENFSKGNGSEEQPFELTEEAMASIYQYDPQTNEVRLRDDWKDRLERNGTDSWVKGVSTEKITDALVKSGDMSEDEKTKFMEKEDHESIKAPDNTDTRNTKNWQESTDDQDNKDDTIKKPGETLFQA
jgi:hypothetical protein